MSALNYINIIAADCFMDSSGPLITKGTLTVTSVDANGQAIPFLVGGGGLVTVTSVVRTIANGSITAALQTANPATSDISVGYTFEVVDFAIFDTVTFPAVAVVASQQGLTLVEDMLRASVTSVLDSYLAQAKEQSLARFPSLTIAQLDDLYASLPE